MKFRIAFILILLFSITFLTAMEVNFFYSDSCPYCREMKPTINQYISSYPYYTWNLYETSNPDSRELFLGYGFEGVPAFVINTDDGRQIKFTGADYLKLKCEVQQMSTEECPTYSADTCIKGSLFKE